MESSFFWKTTTERLSEQNSIRFQQLTTSLDHPKGQPMHHMSVINNSLKWLFCPIKSISEILFFLFMLKRSSTILAVVQLESAKHCRTKRSSRWGLGWRVWERFLQRKMYYFCRRGFFPSSNFETDDPRNAIAIHHIIFFVVLGPWFAVSF